MINVAPPRFLRSAYRKEPVSAFVITMGLVDAAIGGFGGSWALVTVGLGATSLAIGLRWWLMHRSRAQLPETIAEYYLPPGTSRPPLPRLDEVKSRSSRHYN
ncbi:MAG: hypothetical protein RML75_06655 [Cyanobacteriota bacterium SKYGB_h_bin112]|nr:hypothetical protein [Cyanobacteriota bacterium SKYGB_h_bin112]